MTKKEQSERDEAIARLRETLKPGDTVYTTLEHVSRSGMQREIKLYQMRENQPCWISWLAAKSMGYRLGKRDGIIVGGCGMDMGFHLVYNLSRTLFRDSFYCIGEKCPANDHVNWKRAEDKRGPEVLHSDGGYALRHRWL